MRNSYLAPIRLLGGLFLASGLTIDRNLIKKECIWTRHYVASNLRGLYCCHETGPKTQTNSVCNNYGCSSIKMICFWTREFVRSNLKGVYCCRKVMAQNLNKQKRKQKQPQPQQQKNKKKMQL
ncbi:Hypothetical predicted protein [Podarcis lilfordi]|uniref:Secreted protein n=1 Tax=Podarcis lilfordi TaxID=74358 RepID=A0AA35P4I9_9SAUR|nr:Hypothetical predicted protein [Podarcis lilfordi]